MPLTTATQLKDTDTQGNVIVIVLYDYRYNAGGDIIEKQMQPVPDKDGNMTQGLLSGENSNFSFDSRNRLSQTQNSTGSSQYQYDAENQRIALSHNGQTTRFVINSQPNLSQMLLKTDPDGTQTYYVYGLGLIGDESQGNYRSYHSDYRGSTVALSDEAGQVTQRFTYSPYGTLVKGDASQTPFLFNGLYGVMTDANGLYYMRARYYNAEIRRFVNQDLLLGQIQDGGTLNRFAYVKGDPIQYTDPFGLDRLFGSGERAVPMPGGPSHQYLCVKGDPNEMACGNDECLRRNANNGQNNTDRIFVGGSISEKIHFFVIGQSSSISEVIDLQTGKVCRFETHCGTLGPGLYGGISGGLHLV